MKYLIGESNRAPRTLIEKILKSMGHEVDTAEEGDDVLAMYKENMYDLMILQWDIPKRSSLELTKTIREVEGKRPYILIATSEDKKDEMIEALEAGADDFIVKPYEKERLKARLQRAENIVDGRGYYQNLDFDPVFILKDEHKTLKRMANVFQVVASKIKDDASHRILDWIASSSLTIDSKVHHEKEMYFLINFLENAIKEQGEKSKTKLFNRAALKSVEEEHDELEKMIDDIQASVKYYEEHDEGIEEVKKIIDSYSSLVYGHIEREERFLFPLAKKYFYQEDIVDLKERFDSIDQEAGEKLEKIPKQIKRAEEILAIEPNKP